MSTLKPARGSRSCRHVEPGASRLHSELSHRPMSPSTVDSTSTAHPAIERATNALLIATFSHLHHLDQRRATCPRYPQRPQLSDEPHALQTRRGKDHPGGRLRGRQNARVVLVGPQRAMDGSDGARAVPSRDRAELVPIGNSPNSSTVSSPLLSTKCSVREKNCTSSCARRSSTTLEWRAVRWSPTPRLATRAIYLYNLLLPVHGG